MNSTFESIASYSKHHKKIAVVNVDSWLGCMTAIKLAETLEYECKEVQLVCMGRRIDHLDRLKKMKNVKLVKIDYEDDKCLNKAMSGIRCSILLPEMSERRAEHGKRIVCAMKKEKVGGCLMVSCEGAEAEGLHELNSFHEIERCIKNVDWDCYLILRKSFLNQCLKLWSRAVKEQCEFPLTIGKDCAMAPLDVCDLICSIETVIVDYCRHHEGLVEEEERTPLGKHRNKTYTLTGPNKLTAENMVHELSEITGQNIQYKSVSKDELRRYFESLKDEHDVDHDDHHMAPNEAVIRLILDELELIKRDEAGFVSGDLEKVIGHKGMPLRDFFKKEKDSFRKED
ncbi:hypothetical protein BGZ94_009263 [Podila epigama]|nr:hypothetical protein BGZ94_009263 [Podila epigama]